MLPGAPLLLEPLEYPPPYPPPPRALAKERDGSPIRAITIIVAMSFVGFKISILSIDLAGLAITRRHPSRNSPVKT
jgi:hypothetical protein